MFRQEAKWVGDLLKNIDTIRKPVIANIGSSTALFREALQPHIHEHIFKPLQQKGYPIYHVDVKEDNGVDMVADITQPTFATQHTNAFDIVICTNMLEHVEDINAVVQNLYTACRNNGYLLITVPYKYKKHLDPIDNMFRPTPEEITALFKPGQVQQIAAQIITITERSYYKKKRSHYPLWGYREIAGYYLGIRFKVSGVLLQVKK
ncbi:class I SAM-dependent methyltransferase [Panacibacter ginsenosidivorans]|uniref:Class I SAM-dependent methyltransferase n=1 Tax=Panacibacter ginsenosidivorans TaxID=1813871 RepID=A0A5B8VDL7_9BACT|nr:methyltransferase domain-containing protein [Panacibacter ginsenosidivorans]QEC69093.1 class I SAM-dependent methyltransferase [Panacibacter ginsenosidivorans]